MDKQMKAIREHFMRDRFALGLGIQILEIKPGYARCSLKIEDHHLNAVDSVQGGALFTLADFAFALASNAYGNVAVGISCSISYVKATTTGAVLIAEAVEESINPKIGTYHVTIIDQTGDRVATFEGMSYRKKDSITGAQ